MSEFSLIVVCKGRLERLRLAIGGYIATGAAEIIVVDYNCPDGCGKWVEENYPAVKVVRCADPGEFKLAAGRNRGAEVAKSPWLVFADIDVSFTDDFKKHMEAVNPAYFYTVDDSDPRKAESLMGTCIVTRAAWEQAGGYSEFLIGHVPEDLDFYLRLCSHRVRQGRYSPECNYHLPHSDALRTAYYNEKNMIASRFIGYTYYVILRDLIRIHDQPIPATTRADIYKLVQASVENARKSGKIEEFELALETGMVMDRYDAEVSRRLLYKVRLPPL